MNTGHSERVLSMPSNAGFVYILGSACRCPSVERCWGINSAVMSTKSNIFSVTIIYSEWLFYWSVVDIFSKWLTRFHETSYPYSSGLFRWPRAIAWSLQFRRNNPGGNGWIVTYTNQREQAPNVAIAKSRWNINSNEFEYRLHTLTSNKHSLRTKIPCKHKT